MLFCELNLLVFTDMYLVLTFQIEVNWKYWSFAKIHLNSAQWYWRNTQKCSNYNMT